MRTQGVKSFEQPAKHSMDLKMPPIIVTLTDAGRTSTAAQPPGSGWLGQGLPPRVWKAPRAAQASKPRRQVQHRSPTLPLPPSPRSPAAHPVRLDPHAVHPFVTRSERVASRRVTTKTSRGKHGSGRVGRERYTASCGEQADMGREKSKNVKQGVAMYHAYDVNKQQRTLRTGLQRRRGNTTDGHRWMIRPILGRSQAS